MDPRLDWWLRLSVHVRMMVKRLYAFVAAPHLRRQDRVFRSLAAKLLARKKALVKKTSPRIISTLLGKR